MTLIILAIVWLIGIVIADLLPVPLVLLQIGALAGAIGAAIGWRLPKMRLIGLALCALALGGWRYEAAQIPTTPRSIWLLAGQGSLTIEGAVLADPKRTEEGQQVILEVETVRSGDMPGK